MQQVKCDECPALVPELIKCDCGRLLCPTCFGSRRHDRCDEADTVVLPLEAAPDDPGPRSS